MIGLQDVCVCARACEKSGFLGRDLLCSVENWPQVTDGILVLASNKEE